jgi:hypothetical protein
MTAIIVALIGAVVTLLVELMRRQNKRDHDRGYTLLQSIDSRTQAMDSKLDEHGERITAVEVEVSHLKAPKVTVTAGTTRATIEPTVHGKEADA